MGIESAVYRFVPDRSPTASDAVRAVLADAGAEVVGPGRFTMRSDAHWIDVRIGEDGVTWLRIAFGNGAAGLQVLQSVFERLVGLGGELTDMDTGWRTNASPTMTGSTSAPRTCSVGQRSERPSVTSAAPRQPRT